MSRLRRVRHGRRQTRRLPCLRRGSSRAAHSGAGGGHAGERAYGRAAGRGYCLGLLHLRLEGRGRNAARALPDLRRGGRGLCAGGTAGSERAGSGAGAETLALHHLQYGVRGRSAARPLPCLRRRGGCICGRGRRNRRGARGHGRGVRDYRLRRGRLRGGKNHTQAQCARVRHPAVRRGRTPLQPARAFRRAGRRNDL